MLLYRVSTCQFPLFWVSMQKAVMLVVIVLSAFMLGVTVLTVITLSVILQSFIKLSVVMPCVFLRACELCWVSLFWLLLYRVSLHLAPPIKEKVNGDTITLHWWRIDEQNDKKWLQMSWVKRRHDVLALRRLAKWQTVEWHLVKQWQLVSNVGET